MDSSLRRFLQALIFTSILFLIAVIVWLFYCRCLPRRGTKEPGTQGLNSASAPPNRNAARNGNVVMFSYNTSVLLSTDGAASYKLLNPTAIFPGGAAKDASGNALDAGLCCDQRLQYVPQIDRFIWLMQFCGTGP